MNERRNRSGVIRDGYPTNYVRHDMKAAPHAAPPRIARLGGQRHVLEVPDAALQLAQLQGWRVLNPSVVSAMTDRLLVGLRCHAPRQWHSGHGNAYLLGEVARDWTLQGAWLLKDVHVEDLRLFTWGKQLCALGTDTGPYGMPRAQYVPSMTLLRFEQEHRLLSSTKLSSQHFEKNWMPSGSRDGRLRLVYRCQPLVVLDVDGEKVSPSAAEAFARAGHPAQRIGDGARGSSALLPWGTSGYIAVTHERDTTVPLTVYTHRFALFDEGLTRVELGPPFVFEHEGIEFCAGLAFWQQKWVLSYGQEDQSARLAVLDQAQLEAFLPAWRPS